MTLRTRLFLIIGGLAAMLVLAQWWWTRKLTRELADEVDEVVSSVGHSVATFLIDGDTHVIGDLHDTDPHGEHDIRTRILHKESLSSEDLLREDPIHEEFVWTESDTEERHNVHSDDDSKADDESHVEHRTVRVFSHSTVISGDPSRPTGSEPHTELAGRQRSQDEIPQHRSLTHRAASRLGILEFDSGTGDIKLVRGFENLGDDVQVQDLGDGRFTFSFQTRTPTETVDTEGEVVVTESKKQIVKLHVERDGGSRYLWVGGPRHAEHRVEIPQQGMRDKLDAFSRKLLLASFGLLAIGLVLAGAAADRVSAPLRRLAGAAQRVGDGDFDTRVQETTGGEVGQAIRSFNRMSERLTELEAQATELSNRQHLGEIGEIARGLAHSLRNPLNALGLSVEELATGNGAEPDGNDSHRAELAVSARRQIRRIDHSIRSFLALASQGGGTAEDIDLAELAEDVALEAIQGVRDGRIRITTETASDLPTLRAVEPELRAVVQALVVNAVEASPDGGEVNLRLATTDDEYLRLEVADRGPGLPPEIRARLFTPHLSTKASGSGMGLFLAHRIASNRYGGRLELHDIDDGGTRAVLELGDRNETERGSGS